MYNNSSLTIPSGLVQSGGKKESECHENHDLRFVVPIQIVKKTRNNYIPPKI